MAARPAPPLEATEAFRIGGRGAVPLVQWVEKGQHVAADSWVAAAYPHLFVPAGGAADRWAVCTRAFMARTEGVPPCPVRLGEKVRWGDWRRLAAPDRFARCKRPPLDEIRAQAGLPPVAPARARCSRCETGAMASQLQTPEAWGLRGLPARIVVLCPTCAGQLQGQQR